MNDQMPNGLLGQPQQPTSASAPHGKMLGALQGDFSAAQLKAKKLAEAAKLAEAMQSSLDLLVKQGDAVSPEDAIDAASDLVAKGADPRQLATLLADMPANSGAGLSAWLAQKDLQHKQVVLQLEQAQKQAKLELATASLAHLIGHSIANRPQQAPAPASASALAPTSPQPNAPAPQGLQ